MACSTREWKALDLVGASDKSFETKRKPDADAIAYLALNNFIEMRDLVGQDWFLKRKKVERALSESFSEKFIPQYSLVSFTNTPYSEAVRLGNEQDKILNILLQEENIIEIIEKGELREFINAKSLIQS